MDLCEAAIGTLPQLRVAHGAEEVGNLIRLVLSVGLNLQTVNLLQNLGLLVQQELEGQLLLRLTELSGPFDFLGLVESPGVKLVTQNLEVLALLRVHSPRNLLLMLYLLLVAKVSLLRLQLVIFVGPFLAETIGGPPGEPSSDVALNLEGDCLTLFVPHGRRHILARVNNLVVTLINVEARFLHLKAELPHHARRLSFVLVGLDLSFNFIWMEVLGLVSLREGMMVSDSIPVVPETSEVGLRTLLLLYLDSHDLHLVVGEADLHLELVGHDELVGLDRIVVVLLLLSYLVAFLLHHLLLHLLLLELLSTNQTPCVSQKERFRKHKLTSISS